MQFIAMVVSAVLFFSVGVTAAAEAYPSKPVRMIVGFPPGSGSDITARRLAKRMTETLGQSFVVENRSGASASIAAQAVAQADPDGYTLLVSSSGPLILSPFFNSELRYDVIRDFEPLGILSSGAYVLLVSGKSKFRTVQDFIAEAKARPGKLNYASGGTGVTNYVLMEMLKARAGIDLQHIPYKGASPAFTDLAGGQVDVMFEAGSAAEPLIKQGLLRPLATSSAKRMASLPDVRTLSESGYPDFNGEAWTAILAPARTPRSIVDKLSAAVSRITAEASWREEMVAVGSSSPPVMNHSELKKFIASEKTKWGGVINRINIAEQNAR